MWRAGPVVVQRRFAPGVLGVRRGGEIVVGVEAEVAVLAVLMRAAEVLPGMSALWPLRGIAGVADDHGSVGLAGGVVADDPDLPGSDARGRQDIARGGCGAIGGARIGAAGR